MRCTGQLALPQPGQIAPPQSITSPRYLETGPEHGMEARMRGKLDASMLVIAWTPKKTKR